MKQQEVLLRSVVILCFMHLIQMPYARGQFSVGIQTSYAFPWAKAAMSDGNITIHTDGSRDIETFDISLGEGLEYSLFASYSKNSSVAYFLQFTWLAGATNTKTVTVASTNGLSRVKYKGTIFWLTPGVKFNVGKKRLLTAIGAGACIGINGKIKRDEYFQSNTGSSQAQLIYSKSIPVGIYTELGVAYAFSKNRRFSLCLNVQGRSAVFSPKKGEVTKYVEDGTDLLGNLSTHSGSVIYKRNYHEDPGAAIDLSQPATALRIPFPFSSIGVNLGLTYKIK